MFTGDSSHEEHTEADEVYAEHSSDESDHDIEADEPQITDQATDSSSDDQVENDSTLNEIIEAAEVLEIIK